MKCLKPILLQKNVDRSLYPDGLEVPCGKCLACRITKRREWSLRMFHELHYHKDSSFVTLTYDDCNIPHSGSLIKSDLQKFFKRLRKISPNKIKYFACGEYGRKTHRPHYHTIIFGLGLKPEHKTLVMRSWNKCDWSNDAIRDGSFGLVEPASINYVSGYIDDKLDGDLAHEVYTLSGREPVFRLSSNGIGADYADEFADDIERNMYITQYGIKMSLPRYYMKRLGLKADADHRDDYDIELTSHRTGISNKFMDLYKASDESIFSYVDKEQAVRRQNERILKQRIEMKHSKL